MPYVPTVFNTGIIQAIVSCAFTANQHQWLNYCLANTCNIKPLITRADTSTDGWASNGCVYLEYSRCVMMEGESTELQQNVVFIYLFDWCFWLNSRIFHICNSGQYYCRRKLGSAQGKFTTICRLCHTLPRAAEEESSLKWIWTHGGHICNSLLSQEGARM